MGKQQSAIQIVALTILLFSALLFQGTISFSGLFQKKSNDAHIIHTDTHDVEKSRPHTSFSKGILPCLGAAFISGLAGALSQKGVQLAGGKGRNAYLYTMELGLFSSTSLLISLLATKEGRESLGGEGGIFKHWTPFSMIPITVRALGGILTALVHKYAGATRKGFALILGLVMTGVMQSVIERERLSSDEMMAMFLVIVSSYLHLAYPPMAAAL
jgi:UDP-sugar transporter A1/2/3